jgi:hypothetical protein
MLHLSEEKNAWTNLEDTTNGLMNTDEGPKWFNRAAESFTPRKKTTSTQPVERIENNEDARERDITYFKQLGYMALFGLSFAQTFMGVRHNVYFPQIDTLTKGIIVGEYALHICKVIGGDKRPTLYDVITCPIRPAIECAVTLVSGSMAGYISATNIP